MVRRRRPLLLMLLLLLDGAVRLMGEEWLGRVHVEQRTGSIAAWSDEQDRRQYEAIHDNNGARRVGHQRLDSPVVAVDALPLVLLLHGFRPMSAACRALVKR